MCEFFTSGGYFLWAGIGSAVFFGAFAVRIFVFEELVQKKKGWKHTPWWIYQVFFNAAGALVGWIMLYYLSKLPLREFKIEHFVALLIAFVGITGNLPYVVMMGRVPR